MQKNNRGVKTDKASFETASKFEHFGEFNNTQLPQKKIGNSKGQSNPAGLNVLELAAHLRCLLVSQHSRTSTQN
jgi:hypothetical protein